MGSEPEELLEVLDLIQEVINDGSVPRNIKKTLSEVKDSFSDQEGELKIKIDSAMQMMEELSLNPNLPSHARTQIWNLTSVLEDLSKDD